MAKTATLTRVGPSAASGLELPIDHFRLLGVSPTTDVQTVLRTLQQRVDRVPDQGFTLETLDQRNTLLRQSADLLCDPERRGTYESQLTALSESGQPLQAALDLGSNQELGGLLLLHEAGQNLEVFELVSRALQPPQAPALGSGREADLCLLAGLSCLAGAEELRQQRRFESAALLLSQGQQLLQRMGQQPQPRQAIAAALQALRPYRVLDLLSRDLGAVEARSEGLRLLDELVADRGGLEGQADPHFSVEEFQPFFRQIRAYLTVQEQIDLFSRWSNGPGQRGGTADFLATTALTASGFAQRKPERISTARNRLLASGQTSIQPLLASLHLLLGQVDEAEATFLQGSSPELQSWAQRAGDDPLAQVCAYCRDWLARDVLPGYRDLDADPDLEAYFADRDVQAYLDELELAPAPAQPAGFGLAGSALPAAQALLGFGGGASQLGSGDDALEPLADDADDDAPPRNGPWPRLARIGAAVAGLALVAAGGFALLRPRPTPIPVEPSGGANQSEQAPGTSQAGGDAKAQQGQAGATEPALPLRSDAPGATEVQALLEGWLAAKAAVLAGKQPAVPLNQIARDTQLRRLTAEQRDDQARNQTQRIEAKVVDFQLESSTPSRISALATIDYSDQRLNAAGQPQGQPTRLPALRNRYVFARDEGTWRLVSFQRAD